MNNKKQRDYKFLPRANDEITCYEARVIYKEHKDKNGENDFNKVMRVSDARRFAESIGLDLIEINGRMTPPILRIGDYQKYVWELKQNAKKNKRNSVDTKEIQLSVNISNHDMETKAKHTLSFIEKGKQARIVLTMRGRELSRREESSRSFYEFISMLGDNISYVSAPKDEGNKLIVTIKGKK